MDFHDIDGFSKASSILTILALVVGIPGNVLSFVTWSFGKRSRQLAVSVNFRSLAIVDLAVLLLLAVEFSWAVSPQLLEPVVQDMLCKLFAFACTATVRLSTWITVALTIEKVIRLYVPFKLTNTKNNKRVHFINALLALISYAVGSPNLFFNWRHGVEDCLIYRNRVAQTYHKFDILFCVIFFYTLPFIIMLICNILIVVKMLQRSENTVGNACEQQMKQRQTQLRHTSYQVLAVSAITFLTMLPNAAMSVWFFIYWTMDGKIYLPNLFLEIMLLLSTLVYLNSAVNFLLYCLVGRAFRKDVADLFRLCGTRSRETNEEYP